MRTRPSLRARFYGEVPPHPFDKRCDRSLQVLALLAWTSSLPVLFRELTGSWLLAALVPLYLVFALPHALLCFGDFAKERSWAFSKGIFRILATLPLWLWIQTREPIWPAELSLVGVLLFAIAFAHGMLLPRAQRVGTAILACLLPLLVAIIVMGMGQVSPYSYPLALPVLPATLGVALLLQARNHDRLQSTRPLVIPGPLATEEDLRGRQRIGWLTGFACLLLLLISPQRISEPFQKKSPVASTVGKAEEEPQAGIVRSLPPLDDPTAVQPPNSPAPPARPVMPDEVTFDGRMMKDSHRPWRTLFQVRSDLDRRGPFFGADRPLYLRTHTYDRIHADGLSTSPGPVDVIYGEPSGAGEWSWLDLVDEFFGNDAVRFEWQGFPVRSQATRGRADLALLMHRSPLMAMQVPELHRYPGSTYYTSVNENGPFVYRWINRDAGATAETYDADSEVALLPNYRATALPLGIDYLQVPQDERLRPWLDGVRTEVGGIINAQEKIAAILNRYRDYRYSRIVGNQNGLESLLDFRQKQRGYCTYFATAVALELRTVGIPCRLVGGFRLTRWSTKVQAYLGSEREAHLWLEVPNQDGDWVALEATPPGNLASLLAADLKAAEEIAEQERQAVAEEAIAAAEVDPEEDPEKRALEAGGTGDDPPLEPKRGILPSMDDLPMVAIALAFLFVAWQLQRKLKHVFENKERQRLEAEHAALTHVELPPTWLALMEHLADEGLAREPTETMTEFAHVAVNEGVEEAYRLVPVFQRQQRFRFGDRKWTKRDERETQALLDQLRQKSEAS